MEWAFKQNFSTCTFHILNGTVALICFVVVVFLTASSGLVHPLVLVEDSIEGINPNSMNSAGASR